MEAAVSRISREGPSDARQVRSRNALTGALLELLEEKPFDQLTIREISARAGTGYATFFRHYPTKEALLSDVASEEIADLLARTLPVLYDSNSFESTRALCGHVAEHRNLWAALLTGGAAGIVREEFIRQARQLPRDMVERKSWLPADLGVVYGTGGTIDLLAWWLSQDEAYSPEEIAAILNRLIIAPLISGERSPASA
ncbi:TetR/AcrR family transcriptional regulator [Novosphingobium sp. PS1R-30]|uniref:TetR/AcrR family transcriptional regulator n=1 Tax=Novosphingobium anseongense TaxID=3133436 RepID=A0ABU8RXN0_9SPHN|nr:MAG: TetR/AcrR family transcriptional regulator [Novosphingobium sp.]